MAKSLTELTEAQSTTSRELFMQVGTLKRQAWTLNSLIDGDRSIDSAWVASVRRYLIEMLKVVGDE